MLGKNSLLTRIAIGKTIGMAIGGACFFALPFLLPEPTWQLRVGIVFWYITTGAFIALFGVVTWHPVLHIPLPWWLRSGLIGGWMNFLLALFAWEDLQEMLLYRFGQDSDLASPFWIVPAGVLTGLIMGYAATRIGGEGADIVDM